MVRERIKPKPEEVERRLFEFSLGPLRLLDAVFDGAGQRVLAEVLRELLMDWRAYPSRTVYTRKDLLGFATTLGRIESGLREAVQGTAADHVAGIKGEIKDWIRPRSR